MNLADVFTVVLIVLGLLAVFVGIWLMSAGLCPRLIERCATSIGEAPLRCGLVGLGCLVPLIAAGTVVGRVATSAPGKIFSVLFFVFLLLAALVGAAGLALRIGQGLPSARDRDEPWRRVLRGGVVLAITYGTIVMIPLTLIAGFGAMVLAKFGRSSPVTPVAPANP